MKPSDMLKKWSKQVEEEKKLNIIITGEKIINNIIEFDNCVNEDLREVKDCEKCYIHEKCIKSFENWKKSNNEPISNFFNDKRNIAIEYKRLIKINKVLSD